ncbi:MAG TPA: hypothetical protein VM238_18570 [Phycisphaerae bacterium]|nr:hypothetical protein [Phycisphaerae bacterium]
MPEIEPGEYFIVTRGVRLNTDDFGFLSNLFAPRDSGYDGFLSPPAAVANPTEKPPRYDRSYEGRIYRALAVASGVIVAECVVERWTGEKGARKLINTREVEVWPVTEQFARAANAAEEKP